MGFIKFLTRTVAISLIIALSACSDDSLLDVPDEESSEKKFDTFYDLNDCTDKNAGEIAYVISEDAYYVCSDKWYREHRDTKSSSSTSKESSSSVEYIEEPEEISSSSNDEPEEPPCSSAAEPEEASSSSIAYYLETAKELYLTMTSYEQVSKNWDGFDGAGDPQFSFSIKTYADGIQGAILSIDKLLSLDDKRSWSGSKTASVTIPKGIDSLVICAKVLDIDANYHDDYSSGNCASQGQIGYLENYEEISQSDAKGKDYRLYWEWFLTEE